MFAFTRFKKSDHLLADPRATRELIEQISQRDGSVRLHQDATLSVARLDTGEKLRAPLARGRAAWLQLARGRLSVNGTELAAGDGAALVGESELTLEATDGTELLLFDLGA